MLQQFRKKERLETKITKHTFQLTFFLQPAFVTLENIILLLYFLILTSDVFVSSHDIFKLFNITWILKTL